MMPENATFPPTPAWTEHERMLVLYRIAGQMQRIALSSLIAGDRVPLTPELVSSWGERIKLVVSMDRGWLELHREEILVGLDPQLSART